MGVRREGREAAIQFLYQRDLGGAASITDLSDFYAFRGLSPAARRFCQSLMAGLLEKLKPIDEMIVRHLQNYELGRLSAVDRNILRLAIYELLFCPDIPPAVVMNEAIDIAKKYGTEESGRFVNGVLDQVKLGDRS
ncbi:MAG: transcription antitermination factor NusB [Verrucomicrobia bacterium RIFCSPHIGHO2_12_FULL_41_10]|nr:MAG: transcription antitermination factor NusB [Verrucomicrobia bacterium RIFCSPHIGHO2_12_FULL_41_10]HLB32755.1 transcription antitermination factor NusB [Chthoniobacterales bacterium]